MKKSVHIGEDWAASRRGGFADEESLARSLYWHCLECMYLNIATISQRGPSRLHHAEGSSFCTSQLRCRAISLGSVSNACTWSKERDSSPAGFACTTFGCVGEGCAIRPPAAPMSNPAHAKHVDTYFRTALDCLFELVDYLF